MITEIDGFTLCVVLEQHEKKECLKVTAMKGEKMYQGSIYGHMKPEKLVQQSGEEWLQFVYEVIRKRALNTASVELNDSAQGRYTGEYDGQHKINLSESHPIHSSSSSSSSSNLGVLHVKIILNLEDGGEILKALLSLPEKSDKEEVIFHTLHGLGFHLYSCNYFIKKMFPLYTCMTP